MLLRALIIASIAGGSVSTAGAQNALGDGTALERNPAVGSGGLNGAPRNLYRAAPGVYNGSTAISGRRELNFRNAIVTGNAVDGLSFRGDVGYTAPRDFRGALGSDDLFSFRRDSFYSGLAGMGIRGTESLQYQFALTTGNRVPDSIAGSLTASRLGAPIPPQIRGMPVEGGLVDFEPTDPASAGSDERGKVLWTLRSTAAFDAQRRLDPTMLTTLAGSDGRRYGLTASPLRSVGVEPLGAAPGAAEQPAFPGAEMRIDESLPLQRFESFMDSRTPQGPEALETEPSEGEEPVTTGAASNWKRILDEISAQLTAAEAAPPARPADEDGAEGDVAPRVDPLQARREALQRLLDAHTTEALRQAPGEYESLLRPSARDFDAYGAHMAAGERLLAEGRYFEAEERFTRALAARGDDPLAAAGRVHAELGAGLFISASLNLRELLTRHPELIGARYQAKLLPRASRLSDVVIRLRRNIERDPDGPLGRQSALLLAYVGFHTNDGAALSSGLDQMRAGGDEALADVLEAVWTPAGADQP